MALTFRAFIIRNSHVPIQGDSDNPTLGGLKLIAVRLYHKSMRQYDMVSDAKNGVGNIRGTVGDGSAYIHGSVDESPLEDLVRSLERPGAKTPRPYPRTETHHGSFTVNLNPQHPSIFTHSLLSKKSLTSISRGLQKIRSRRGNNEQNPW